ncbi:hypothetical protein MSPP1_003614 [Malassezia sp. CBS 17886]|nr:hypothetical protein MSPP1_003614 [Malassezia sp. CBS 17886]
MVLPERTMAPDEAPLMAGLHRLYSSFDMHLADLFTPDVLYAMPTGEVVVGRVNVLRKFHELAQMHPGGVVRQRLLQTPESLPAHAMVIDQEVASSGGRLQPTRSLLVIKRRDQDGRIWSMTEEEGHCKATVPLAARVAAPNTFNSPTDNMVSPCTSKLNLSKRRHHLKPTALFAGMTSMAGGVDF